MIVSMKQGLIGPAEVWRFETQRSHQPTSPEPGLRIDRVVLVVSWSVWLPTIPGGFVVGNLTVSVMKAGSDRRVNTARTSGHPLSGTAPTLEPLRASPAGIKCCLQLRRGRY